MKLLLALGVILAAANGSQLLQDFVVGNGKFAAGVYKELLKTNSGNFMVCPASAEIVLSLLNVGAGGETTKQISSALHLPEDKEKVKEIFRELTSQLQSTEDYTLSSANKIYVKDGYAIKDQFKSTAVDVFKADIQTIDFEKGGQAANEMNKWVEEKTQKKIKNLINPNDLNEDTRSVLISAMYFHGKWLTQFDKKDTSEMPFYLNNKDYVLTDMMAQAGEYKYLDNTELNAKFLELPYAGDDVTMTIVLPNNKEGLPALEARIDDLFVSLQNRSDVYVVIPKFKFETLIEFNDILKNLGIVNAFNDNADIGNIIVNQYLKIDKVVQKTFVEVEEEGTKAAAATTVIMASVESIGSPQPQIEYFIADHPFIFFIKVKDIVLFVGRYVTVAT